MIEIDLLSGLKMRPTLGPKATVGKPAFSLDLCVRAEFSTSLGPLLHPPKLAVQKTVLQDGPTSPLARPF